MPWGVLNHCIKLPSLRADAMEGYNSRRRKGKKEKNKGHLPVCFAAVEGVCNGRQTPLCAAEPIA